MFQVRVLAGLPIALAEPMTNTRLIAIGYVVLGIATALFLEHVLVLVFGEFGPTQPLTRPLVGEWTWSTVIAFAICIATALWLWTNPKTHEVSLEIASELRKVSWPGVAETRAATIAVIVASIISAVLLGLFDVLCQFVTDNIQ